MLLLKSPPEEELINLINEVNVLDVPLEPGGLYYGVPKSAPNGMTTLNTTTNYNNFDYEGYCQFTYKRVNLTNVFGNTRPAMPTVKVPDIYALLPKINKVIGINLLEGDIENAPIVWGAIDSQQNIDIIASAHSLGYEGSFTVQFIVKRYQLPDVAKKIVLDVLKHPDEITKGKVSITMSTWGIDFTELFNPSTVLKNGQWADMDEITMLMMTQGFTNWPQAKRGTLSIRQTKDFPAANKTYSHFIFQGPIDAETYHGNAYFHFNM